MFRKRKLKFGCQCLISSVCMALLARLILHGTQLPSEKFVETRDGLKQYTDKHEATAGLNTRGKNAAIRNVALAYYKGPTSSKVGDDFTFEILQGLLGEQLARNGLGLSLVPDRQGCESAKFGSKRFDLMIVGSGSLLSKSNLCALQYFLNKTVLFLGTGYGDYNPVHRQYKKLEAFKHADIKILLDNYESAHSKVWSNLPKLGSRLVGGLRGVYSQKAVDHLTASQTTLLPIIGDLGLLAAKYYKEVTSYQIGKLIPAGEKFFLYNAAMCSNGRELEKAKLQAEFQRAVLDLAGRYHLVVYSIGRCDPDPKFIQKLRKSPTVLGEASQYQNKMIFLSKIPDVLVLGKLFKEAYFTVNHQPYLDYFSTSYETPFLPILYTLEELDLIDSLNVYKYTVMAQKTTAAEIVGKVNRITHDRDKILSRMAELNEQTHKNYVRVFEAVSHRLAMQLTQADTR